MKNNNNWQATLADMQRLGMNVPVPALTFGINNASDVLRSCLTFFLQMQGRELQWLPEYDEVVQWLTNNKGRGLFLYGNCGRGKTLLCRYVLPAILLKHCGKVVSVYDVQQMNATLDAVLQKYILSVDDIGTEEAVNTYGNRRMAFSEIMDAVEKQGKLLIVSSNLNSTELKERYGDRTLDRIRACTSRILFRGNSLRG